MINVQTRAPRPFSGRVEETDSDKSMTLSFSILVSETYAPRKILDLCLTLMLHSLFALLMLDTMVLRPSTSHDQSFCLSIGYSFSLEPPPGRDRRRSGRRRDVDCLNVLQSSGRMERGMKASMQGTVTGRSENEEWCRSLTRQSTKVTEHQGSAALLSTLD